jgi:hypothetical protein
MASQFLDLYSERAKLSNSETKSKNERDISTRKIVGLLSPDTRLRSEKELRAAAVRDADAPRMVRRLSLACVERSSRVA